MLQDELDTYLDYDKRDLRKEEVKVPKDYDTSFNHMINPKRKAW
ncbi:hypothetical protein [Myroides indicus]|uniref:Uncharacterized protein n=1 Tax=Myroides indicus TaxID=1323422 RepID=A0A4R7F7K3_9FLAO|nr:hypothetical protein [Myroides indicus]TDS64184.1 hypothetical protein C8P70_10533 [Myroides indicus]